MEKVSESKLRAWWSHRQGLDRSLTGQTAGQVLARTGWSRSVGGCAPYLTLFARAGLRRAEVDAALAKLEIHELPAARGCTWVVPAPDFPLALAAGEPFAGDELKVARRLGVPDQEIDKLCAAVRKALAAGPLDPDGLKKNLGEAVRNLGAEGVKKGLTTTLPVALGLLQSAGEIRRVPVNGRLDQQRYRYAAWKCAASGTFTDLARHYFGWIGPATVAEFQAFAGLGVKAAKAAVEPLGLVPATEDRFLLPEDREEFFGYQAPKRPQYSLVSTLDGIGLLRNDLKTLLDPEDQNKDLPGNEIFDRGRLIGRWEFDPDAGAIVWASFVPCDKALEQAVREMEAFVREDLGDARSFGLDNPKSRAPRIEALRSRRRRHRPPAVHIIKR
jgi:hypothetical protein